MERLDLILSLIGTATGFMVAAATLLGKLIKTIKEKKKALNAVKLCDALMLFVQQAESFTGYSSAEKKEFVLTKANRFAIEQKIAFDTGFVSRKIEELVRLTKEVNKREKDLSLQSQTNKKSQNTVQAVSQKYIIGVKQAS